MQPLLHPILPCIASRVSRDFGGQESRAAFTAVVLVVMTDKKAGGLERARWAFNTAEVGHACALPVNPMVDRDKWNMEGCT
jgi:hypothetical protein